MKTLFLSLALAATLTACEHKNIPAAHSTGDVGILLFPNEESIAYIGCFDNNPYNLRLFEKIAQRNDDLWFQRECAVSTQV